MDTIQRVHSLLNERNISLYSLSRTNDIPYSTIKTTERRGGQLSVETIELICNALGISLSEFFRESGEKYGA